MLKRSFRLNLEKSDKFKLLAKTDLISLAVGKESVNSPKFGVVVPARFCRKAVGRNRIKRLVWECLGKMVDEVLPANYKIQVWGDFSKDTAEKVCENLKKTFVKAGHLK